MINEESVMKRKTFHLIVLSIFICISCNNDNEELKEATIFLLFNIIYNKL